MVLSLAFTPALATAASSQQTWAISAEQPCIGLSAIWTPPLSALKALVKPWTPAQGPMKGHGVFVLFVTRCQQSAIDKRRTGPSIVGAALVAIKPPPGVTAAKARAAHWAAIVNVYGDPASDVVKLFARHGFAVTPARLELNAGRASLADTFSIVTGGARIELRATFESKSAPMSHRTVMLGANGPGIGEVTGAESSIRQSNGNGTVAMSGDSLPVRLELAPKPDRVVLDTDFRWRFVFKKCADLTEP